MLAIPYINAMIIFRTFKSDNKIVSYAKQHKSSDSVSAFSMETLRQRTIKVLLNAIEAKMFSEKETKKIMSANTEVFLEISSVGPDGYDFEATFKTELNETTGQQSIVLPPPSKTFAAGESPVPVQPQIAHESLKEELFAERNSLHNFLLK